MKTALEKITESRAQARFPDCDPFNHLNNSKYIDYIINAREDQLLEYYGINIHQMVKETGNCWVVAQNQIAYLAPVDIMEVMTIQTRLLHYNERSLLVEALVWNEDKSVLKAIMWSKQVHYNLRTRKAHPHAQELLEFFSEIVYPLDSNQSFEDRLGHLKRNNHNEIR